MKRKRSTDRSPPLDAGTQRLVKEIADALHAQAYDSAPLPAWKAAAYAAVLQRIANGQQSETPTNATLKSRGVALSYKVRLELEPGTFGKVAYAVSQLYGCAESTVKKLASEHGAFADAWLARMDSNVEYSGLDRAEMLKRELLSIEDGLPTPSNKR